MGFLNPYFLFGLSAVSIPIIIHLIFRVRKRRVEFSTLRFLRAVVEKNARKLRVREMVVLLLRVIAYALVALAFARPFFRGETVAGTARRGRADAVFVLDDSLSMRAAPSGKNFFEHSREELLARLGELSLEDRCALVLTTEPVLERVSLTSDLTEVIRALRSSECSFSTGKLDEALARAHAILADSTADGKLIIVASDLQRGNWEAARFERLCKARPEGVEYELIAFGSRANAAIADVKPLTGSWSADSPVGFSVVVRDFGTGKSSFPATLKLRGRAVARVSLSAGEASSVEAEVDSPGEITGELRLETDDPLLEDDVFYLALSLVHGARVLCVEEEPEKAEFVYFNETYYIAKALEPWKERALTPFRPIIRAARELSASDLSSCQAALLAGVRKLSDEQAAFLEEWVEEGGGLGVFLGGEDASGAERSPDAEFYSERKGLFPAEIGRLREHPLWAPERLTAWDASHPVFASFVHSGGAGLSTASFLKYYDIEPAPGARVLARFSDGSPFCVEGRLGKGKAVVFATSPAAKWSDLPKRKAFVPLVNDLLRHLSGLEEGGSRQYTVGAAQKLRRAGRVVFPDGREVSLARGEELRMDVPGIYRFLPARGAWEEESWAANVPPEESDLNGVTQAELEEALKRVGTAKLAQVTALDGASPEELKARSGNWRALLLAALAVLAVEALVANVFFRR